MKNWWNGNFDYLKSRKICWYISLGLILVGILFNVIFGTSLDVTFRGGNELQYTYTGEVDVNKLSSDLNAAGFKATVRKAESANTPVIKISIPGDALDQAQKAAISKLFDTNFKDNKLTDAGSQSLSPTMGTLFLWKCLVALAIAAVFLLAYVGIRFRKIGGLTAACCAVAALFHDMVIVYFTFVIFRIPLNDNFVAVLLAILGYSLNSTIVIFDRIRENRKILGKNATLPEIVNISLNQSVRRNVSTTVTTVAAMSAVAVVALVMHLDSVVSFAVPLLFGLLSGFYSSQFLCTPTWVLWAVKDEERKVLKAKTKKTAKKSVKKIKK